MPGILTMGKRCKCNGKPHEPIVGKNKSEKAAAYPPAFCKAYAKLAVDHFVKMGTMEFLEGRHKLMEDNIEYLRMKASDLEGQAARAWSNAETFMDTEGYKRWEEHPSSSSRRSEEAKAREGTSDEAKPAASASGPVWIGGRANMAC